ncbi:hypothetical protein Adi01nite_44430 [Amorphoplanes digitatis]|nr:hypothetical protein GCM10020092_084100 [Actinoplanes digitatis]GID95031.1 hypothetical protein Adi01nite_44430 [Actinoplanes digitatis]
MQVNQTLRDASQAIGIDPQQVLGARPAFVGAPPRYQTHLGGAGMADMERCGREGDRG